MEVLVALSMTAAIAGLVLTVYSSHYRLAKNVLLATELNYSLLRSGQVVASAVRTADTVQWDGKILKVSSTVSGKAEVDSYYLADKNHDGQIDLYRERQAVPTPIATGLTGFTCAVAGTGLWKINLTAGENTQTISWERVVKQKLCQ